MPRRALMVYINPKRGSVVADGDMIDTNHEKNVSFFNKREAKGLTEHKGLKPKPVQIPREETFIEPSSEYEGEPDESGILPLPISERNKKHFDALVSERNSELLALKTEKIRGEVIPYALVMPVFLQHNQSISKAYKDEFDEWLRLLAKKYDLSGADVAVSKGESVKWINTAITKATEMSKRAVVIIVNDYAVKKQTT